MGCQNERYSAKFGSGREVVEGRVPPYSGATISREGRNAAEYR
jgi:hypothetical protein